MARPGVGGNGRPADDVDRTKFAREFALRYVKDAKVVHGKDGWLFLDNDHNWFLRQYSGDHRLSQEQLEQWRQLLEDRVALSEEIGARYYFMIAPESPAVYPEMLPDTIDVAEERTVHQLMAHLESASSPARVIYPLEDLLAEKQNRPLYPKIDTHWNDFGAFVAYRRLARELRQEVPIHEVTEEELIFKEVEVLGDLGFKLGVQALPQPCARYLYARARQLSDNLVLSTGLKVVVENPHAPPTKCVLFGDSCSHALMMFIAQTFGRVVWTWSSTVDYELIREERPDVVISEMIERFLIVVPDDSGAKSTRELETEKTASGMLRPRLRYWDEVPGPGAELRAPSIETIETMRAHLLSRGRREDAVLVSVMAYAGLTPSEALRLSWRHVEDGSLTVEPPFLGHASSEVREQRKRSVQLLEPLMEDLSEWRSACGSPTRSHVFPNLRRRSWSGWMRKEYRRAIRRTREAHIGPGALHDTFATLLIQSGASPSELASQMGMARGVAVTRYWYLLDETTPGANAVSASDRIRKARAICEARVRSSRMDVATQSRLQLGQLSSKRSESRGWEDLPQEGLPRELGIRLPRELGVRPFLVKLVERIRLLLRPGSRGWGDLPLDSLGVRPLLVESVERIRARLLSANRQEEATFVSVMAYAGVPQAEALQLRWPEVKELSLEMKRLGDGNEKRPRQRERTVALLAPLAEDLAEWHAACGSPELGWIFPHLRKRNWREWVDNDYRRAAKSVDKGRRKPNYLRYTFCSLLIGEGVSPDELACQLGLSPDETAREFGHLFDKVRDEETVSASDRIREARARVAARRISFSRILGGLRRSLAVDRAQTPPQPGAAVQEDS